MLSLGFRVLNDRIYILTTNSKGDILFYIDELSQMSPRHAGAVLKSPKGAT